VLLGRVRSIRVVELAVVRAPTAVRPTRCAGRTRSRRSAASIPRASPRGSGRRSPPRNRQDRPGSQAAPRGADLGPQLCAARAARPWSPTPAPHSRAEPRAWRTRTLHRTAATPVRMSSSGPPLPRRSRRPWASSWRLPLPRGSPAPSESTPGAPRPRGRRSATLSGISSTSALRSSPPAHLQHRPSPLGASASRCRRLAGHARRARRTPARHASPRLPRALDGKRVFEHISLDASAR
jgi:hypothetical protein